MDAKKVLMVIIIASFSITLIVMSLVGIYKYKPTWLGMPPNPKDTVAQIKEDTVYIEPSVRLSEKKYSQLNRELAEKDYYKAQKDSFLLLSQKLQDSIKRYQLFVKNYQDSVKWSKNNLVQSFQKSNKLIDSLNTLNAKYMKQVDKVKQAELKISDQEKFISQKEDSSQKIAFQNFAKIYNNSKPADVAKILEQIDERDAAMILNMMSKKKAGKIIESMKPEQAAAILLLGNSK